MKVTKNIIFLGGGIASVFMFVASTRGVDAVNEYRICNIVNEVVVERHYEPMNCFFEAYNVFRRGKEKMSEQEKQMMKKIDEAFENGKFD